MATLIKERYEVLETLGAGGEARVVKALDRQHDRFVALKMRPGGDQRAREDLLGEARILLAVPPHHALPLVREDFFDGDYYVVAMDWVDGTDLGTLLSDRGRPGLAPSSVLAYLSEAAEALTHLHTQDPPVIHGDVKPGNLILTRGGRVKLVDFGLSSAPGALQRRAGTPGFRAPELASGGPPSRASDIYALAATAFALLTGAAPAGVLPTWDGIDPAQAEQLEAAVRLGIATDPSRRPATPGELIERLRAGWTEALPSGVVTFCLSDIEGSTELWDSDPVAMAAALVRHDELIADCVQAHGGQLVKSMGEGDSTVSAFESAPPAVAAAVAVNAALAAEVWPPGVRIAVRCGLHTGEIERRGAEYRGTTINIAARLRAQADGGQVFLSSVTSDLVAAHLPDGYELVDIGRYRLKGIKEPEQVRALKGLHVRAPLPASQCPYRGLLAFEAEDRQFFFGREEVVAEIVGRLGAGRLLAVVGASGSGKSSVLRAGVLAAVRSGEIAGLRSASLLTPGPEPELNVPDEADRVVIVDQFEELFTLCEDEQRRTAFIDGLLRRQGAVAIGVRADLYGRLSGHVALARAVAANQVLLGAMDDHELERAVTEPARLAGLKLEPGLVELVLRDVGAEPGALPLLSHALRATWERREGRMLTVEGYRQSGGVGAAIAQTADEVVGSLPADRRLLMRGMFVRLTELGEGIAETRRRVTIGELVPQGVPSTVVEGLLEQLADARLVTLGEGTAEVAHEVLIREWPTLRGWLEEDREGIRLQRQLGDAARMWDDGGREPSDLYRGARLATASDWAGTHRDDLNAGERAFIDASIDKADSERRAQARANRRLRALLSVAVVLLVAAVAAGIVALVQRGHARAQALTSDAERLGALAQSEPNLDRAMLLAVAAVKLQNRVQTRSDLLAALQRSPALIRIIRPFTSEIEGAAASPDGRLLGVGDSQGAVEFVDLSTWRVLGAAVRLGATIAPKAMSFSPDGRTLLVVTEGAARTELDAIDVASRRIRRLGAWQGLVPPPPTVSAAVAYSPDGSRIALSLIIESPTENAPRTARLLMLDATTGRVRWNRAYPLRPGQQQPYVAFLPSGALLSSAQQGDTLLWNPRTGGIVRRFRGGGDPAISADGRHVALAVNSPSLVTASASIVILDLRTGANRTLSEPLPEAWSRSIAFAPGGRIVVGAMDGIHIYDLATGRVTATYTGQAGLRSQVTVDPHGAIVISGGQDGSIAAFDLSGAQRLGRFFSWNAPIESCGYPPCAVVSRQDVMATDQGNGTIALVDLHTLKTIATLPARNGTVANGIAFAPDGRTLITGGTNRTVTFWDLSTDRVIRTFTFADPVWWLAVSPDGKLLAVQTQAANSPDARVLVVRIPTGAVLQSHLVRHGYAGVAFTRDSREVVALGCCAAGSVLAAYDARTGAQLFSRTDVDGTTFNVSPNAHLLVVGTGDGKVVFLDARTGRKRGSPIQVAAGQILDIRFSLDGSMFAAASGDGSASIWDVRSRTRLGNPFPKIPAASADVVFEPSGRVLLVYLSDAFEWPTDVRTWERFACQLAGRDLTRSEWHDLLPNRAYQHVCPRRG